MSEMDEVIIKIARPPKPKGLSAEALYPKEMAQYRKDQITAVKTVLKNGTSSRYTLGQAILRLCEVIETMEKTGKGV